MKEAEAFLMNKHELFIDVISKETHYCDKNSGDKNFEKMDNFIFNSMYREIKNEGINISKDDLKTLLYSDFIPVVNPFLRYLESVEYQDDGIDYIDKVASTVKTTNDEYFRWVFKKWLVNLVACVVEEGVTNENMIILVGKQGIGKTRWIESLLPKQLEAYYYGDEIVPNNKDHKNLFATKILINLDELASFSKSKVEQFKSILSAKRLTFRRPYGTYNEDFNRIASVIGSSNHKDILMDSSGNRRYLCVDALTFESIDPDDLNKAYKQAFQMYQQGFQYFFDKEETQRINELNLDYMKVETGIEIINQYFEPCETDDASAKFMNATKIKKYLENTYNETNIPSPEKLGRFLTNLGFKTKKIKGINQYALLLKSQNEEREQGFKLRRA